MKTIVCVVMACMIGGIQNAKAQTLGDFSPKEQRGAYGPRKFPSKDIYIANFSVNFQLYNLKTASTKGGFEFGKLSGKTKASLAVGLDIPTETVQQITDDTYQVFVADLKAQGFNVLNADAAQNTNYYEGYQRIDNMDMSLSEAPGVLTVYPSNTPFYVKGFDNSGKIKRKGILSVINNEAGRDEDIRTYGKLSHELNDATIVNVNMYVLFLDVNKPYQGNGAKIVANTNLRLPAYEHIKSRVQNKSTLTKLGITGKSKEHTHLCITAIDFVGGKNKIGGSPLGTYKGVLKKDLQINGVVAKEKVESYAKTDADFIGTETAFGKLYRADNISVENTALIRANAQAYQSGATQALTLFLKHHVNEFKNKFF